MSIKRKIAITTMAAGLVLSSVPTLGPVHITKDSVAYAAETTSIEELAARLTRIYNYLTDADKTKVWETSKKLKDLTKDQWKDILGDTVVNKVDDELGVGMAAEIASEIGSLVLTTNPDTLVTDINNFRTKYADEFNALFGADLTVDQMLNFFVALEEKLTDKDFILSQINASSLDEVVVNAINKVTEQIEFKNLDGALYKGIGVGLNGLVEIKEKLSAEIDPNNVTLKAVVKSLATEKGAELIYGDSTTLKVGDEKVIDFQIQYQGAPQKITSFVDLVSSNPAVADFQGNVLKAKSAGTTTVSAKVLGDLELDSVVFTVAEGDSNTGPGGGVPIGGGGNTGQPGDQVTVPVEEKSGTNEKGQTTVTVTPNEQEMVKAVTNSESPVNLVLKVSGNADLTTAPVSAKTINELAKDNPNNTVTLQSPNGTITISAKELSEALTAAAAAGLDATNAQVNIIIEKGTEADKTTLSNALGSSSEVLARLLQTKVVVKSGDKQYEVKEYKGYVSSTVELNGSLTASQLVGVEFTGTGATASKESTVTTAAEDVKYSPVPTVIEVKDGKTVVKVNKKTNKPFTVVKTNKTFTDIAGQWFTADVQLMANKLLVNGRSATEFVPQGTLTRAEFATMLVRALGLSEDVTNGIQFTDVRSTEWYAGYVGAAAKAGLVNGYTDGTFKPNAPVSRQEAAKMIVEAIKFAGGKVEVTSEEKASLLAKFADSTKVSDWATDYIAAVAKAGILQGDNKGNINPLNNSTRAESVALLKRFLKNVNFLSE